MHTLAHCTKILPIKITVPGLRRRIKKNIQQSNGQFKHFIVRIGRHVFIKDSAIRLLSTEKHNSTSKAPHTRRGVKNKNHLTKSQLLALLSSVVSDNHALITDNHSLLNRLKHRPKLTDKKTAKRIQDYNNRGPFYRLFHRLK